MLVTLRDAYDARFTRTEELLATVVDVLQVVAFYSAVAVVKNPQSVARPRPFPRPGEPQRNRRGTTLGDLRRMREVPHA